MENIQTSDKPKEEQTVTSSTTSQPTKQIKTEVLGKTSLKSSQEKSLRKQLTDCIPNIADLLDRIWPKKSNILVGKIKNSHTTVYFVNDEPVFIQVGEEKVLPHIRLLHKYPQLLPTCQVDKGAIPFIIGGANVMIPGLTSKGGKLPEVKAESYVAILCEGKQHALAIGKTTMSKEDMKRINKGIGIELLTYIGDESWNIK